jgi:hypothetical protein
MAEEEVGGSVQKTQRTSGIEDPVCNCCCATLPSSHCFYYLGMGCIYPLLSDF